MSFLFCAYLTILLAIIQFLLPPQRSHASLDQALRGILLPQRLRLANAELFEKLAEVIESAILLISDLQLITSLAILISGFVQLFKGIPLYLWSTIVALAWFSVLTHLATLTSLRHFFRSRPVMATSRVILMGIVLVLLSVAMVPTGFEPQNFAKSTPADLRGDGPGNRPASYFLSVPTLCLYSTSSTREAWAGFNSAVKASNLLWTAAPITASFNVGLIGISIAYLTFSYATRAVRISLPLSDKAARWLKLVPMDYLQNHYKTARDKMFVSKNRRINDIYKRLLLTVIVLAEAFYEIWESMLWEILWLASALVWGTLRFIELRHFPDFVGEASWGFGQVLALVLCVLPLWESLNTFFRPKHSFLPPNAGSEVESPAPSQRDNQILQEIKQTTWFRDLTGLILGLAAMYAAATLFYMPAGLISGWSPGLGVFASRDRIFGMLRANIISMVFNLVTFFIFVSACLAFHFRQASHDWPSSTHSWAKKFLTNHRLRNFSWRVLLVLVLALQMAFGIFMFPRLGYSSKAVHGTTQDNSIS